jgi:site-specific DNA-cytosine methylase
MKPLCVDLYAGLGGWSEGFLAEGYECIGYDIEAHDYGTGGYPGKLILRDIRSIHGSELKDAAVIVASPPCQAYSYRAMPWKRAKALPPPDNTLFNECFRIQREASEAAGHHIPMIVENVRGAQKWVGRASWNYGSYYLWGDVPALMPFSCGPKMPGRNMSGDPDKRWGAHVTGGYEKAMQDALKRPGRNFHAFENGLGSSPTFCGADHETRGIKLGKDAMFSGPLNPSQPRYHSSGSNSRKAASAMIAKIPFPLSSYIAKHFKSVSE